MNLKEAFFPVGGQAVLEGVMMRSPQALAIAVRRPDGTVLLKDEPYTSLAARHPLLKRPLLRGPVVLLESLVTGIRALSFSAQVAVEEEEGQSLGWGSIALTMGGAFVLAFLLFGFLPHYLSGLAGYLIGRPLTPADFLFHVIDGVIKLIFILGYIWGISRFKEIHRVFEYHGAEHKSICAYEAGEPLTVENARRHGTCHPRCGTSFLLVVLLVSLTIFTIFFPMFPPLTRTGILNNLVQVFIKVALMFPIAAISYEIIRWGGRHAHHPLARFLLWPGLATQRLTTQEPDDSQLEVALEALKAVLAREGIVISNQ
ncbi:MAG: DUF1385 domain-containing protein [Deltaproteobacteria bacterium]|nr:MAG: DUF1385 domain-containing protein [Deltaproteobacteria bacterium]